MIASARVGSAMHMQDIISHTQVLNTQGKTVDKILHASIWQHSAVRIAAVSYDTAEKHNFDVTSAWWICKVKDLRQSQSATPCPVCRSCDRHKSDSSGIRSSISWTVGQSNRPDS